MHFWNLKKRVDMVTAHSTSPACPKEGFDFLDEGAELQTTKVTCRIPIKAQVSIARQHRQLLHACIPIYRALDLALIL